MKKEECISNFVASLIIAFPFMAMFAFLIEVFTIETFIEISKNHGSLVAGVLGVLGTIALVVIQIKLNRENIAKSRDLVHEERFEMERDRALNNIELINSYVTKTASAAMDPKLHKSDLFRMIIIDTNIILDNLPVVVNFCQKNLSRNQEAESIYKTLSFMLFYTYMINSLLNFVLNNSKISKDLIYDMEVRITDRLSDKDIYIDAVLKDLALENIRFIAGDFPAVAIMHRWSRLNHSVLLTTKDWVVFTEY